MFMNHLNTSEVRGEFFITLFMSLSLLFIIHSLSRHDALVSSETTQRRSRLQSPQKMTTTCHTFLLNFENSRWYVRIVISPPFHHVFWLSNGRHVFRQAVLIVMRWDSQLQKMIRFRGKGLTEEEQKDCGEEQKDEDEGLGPRSNVSLLDQHQHLKEKAEGSGDPSFICGCLVTKSIHGRFL